jgi:septal ring factor EnvC (AmiA/AmiB activator)
MSLSDRLDGSSRRIDAMLDGMTRREMAARQREDAERMMAEREQARADSERCRQFQIRYDDAFQAFGVRTPAPVEGERSGAYRKRLFEHSPPTARQQ